jgi:hypothetical protein
LLLIKAGEGKEQMVKIPKRVSDRLSKEIGKFQKTLRTAKVKEITESDTVGIVRDMLARVFGFDNIFEITSEYAIKGTFCDLAIKLDEKIEYLIEVKAIGITLNEGHLKQAVHYGADEGIWWVVLTNGINWEIHKIRIEKEKAIHHDLVCSFNFLELNHRKQEDQDKVFLLCKEGIEKAALDKFFDYGKRVNRVVVALITISAPVVSIIRKELRKISPDVKVSDEEIKNILTYEVLKRDIFEGEAAKATIKRVKKQLKKQVSKKKENIKEPLNTQDLPIE